MRRPRLGRGYERMAMATVDFFSGIGTKVWILATDCCPMQNFDPLPHTFYTSGSIFARGPLDWLMYQKNRISNTA
jgi:hypothetical protein